MYSNTGKKVMGLASVLAGLAVVVTVIEGIVLWVTMGRMRQSGIGFLVFLLVVAVGSVVAYIGYLLLYAFGELVDNSSQILQKISDIDKADSSRAQGNGKMYPNAVEIPEPSAFKAENQALICPFCKREQPKGTVFCGNCGAQIGSNLKT